MKTTLVNFCDGPKEVKPGDQVWVLEGGRRFSSAETKGRVEYIKSIGRKYVMLNDYHNTMFHIENGACKDSKYLSLWTSEAAHTKDAENRKYANALQTVFRNIYGQKNWGKDNVLRVVRILGLEKEFNKCLQK